MTSAMVDQKPKVILVAGSHDKKKDSWWMPKSPFAYYLWGMGFVVVGGDRPYTWTTDLDWATWGDRHRDWKTGGENLYAYIVPPLAPEYRIAPEDTRIICHSHGLNVVLYAAAYGLKINRLLSICSPIRKDMIDVAAEARKNITHWEHIYNDAHWWNPFSYDKWQLAGAILDGRFGYFQSHPLADLNTPMKGIDHSRLLREADYYPRLVDPLKRLAA